MSLGHGSKIVTDGLVFYYDIHNTVKSWKGKPTTNIRTSDILSDGYNGNASVANNSYVLTAPDGSAGWSSLTVSSVNTNYRLAQFPYNSMPLDTPVTFSIELYNPGPNTLQVFIDGNIGEGWTNIPFGYSKWEWTHTTSVSRSLAIWFGAEDQLTSQTYSPERVIYYKNYQVEVGNFATPYVNGTRTNTQSILDMTNNKTITADNITYDADGNFSYNGSTNYASFPTPLDVLQPYTVIQILKPNVPLSTGATPPTGAGRKTSLVGPGPVWNPGIWITNDNLRVHSDKDYKDLYINWTDTNYRMVGMTFDGTSSQVIFNDGLSAGDRVTAYSPADPTTMYLGAETSTGNVYNWNGIIAITMFYNRALTALEVKQIFNTFKGRFGL